MNEYRLLKTIFENFTVEQYNALFADLKAGKISIDSETPESMKDALYWTALSLILTNVTVLYE